MSARGRIPIVHPAFDFDPGTAAVTLGAVLSAIRVTRKRLKDQHIVLLGAGSASVGVADYLREAMVADPVTVAPDTPIGEVARLLHTRHIHRVLVGFLPVSTILAYGSSAVMVLLIRWAKHGKPRGYLVAWLQHQFRPKAHSARRSDPPSTYLVEDEQ